MKCLVCNAETPKPLKGSRWGAERKYCSSKCCKAQWRLNNAEKDLFSKAQWLKNNPEKRKESSSSYQKRNKAYYNQYSSLRSRHVLQAKPKVLSELDCLYLEEFYDLASKLNLEVDHIIPIKHPKVCGLHVPANLQLLSRAENARKSNKFNEDVVCIFKDKK